MTAQLYAVSGAWDVLTMVVGTCLLQQTEINDYLSLEPWLI